ALVLAGTPPPRWEPAPVAAARADARFGTVAASTVAERAERAAFGPPGPVVNPRAHVRELRRAARATLPLWRRWWWWFDPRVLRRPVSRSRSGSR
ncbi:hypothetical protein, partial [Nocardioides aquiterrae]|uniref:hypothetical protein n=1 Tax=Nocardioides aquiterrae TaxID=203799 RepID=UPI0031CF8F44